MTEDRVFDLVDPLKLEEKCLNRCYFDLDVDFNKTGTGVMID